MVACQGTMSVTVRKTAKTKRAPEPEWEQWDEEEWAEEYEEEQPVPKKVKKAAKPEKETTVATPEDLEQGTSVLYWDGVKGIVRDAYVPLDEFWVADEESGELVRDETGEIVPFKSSELRLFTTSLRRAVPAQVPEPPVPSGPAASVMLFGLEDHMMRILQHFGNPSTEERSAPQQLLAIPCSMCQPQTLLSMASEGIDETVRDMAKRMRPDINVAVRAFHLKSAVEQLGSNIFGLEGYYCLASVDIPYSLEDIATSEGYEQYARRELQNQIDIGVSATKEHEEGEESEEETAKGALGARCGLCIADALWDERGQVALRSTLEVDIPLNFQGADGSTVFVLFLPEDTVMSVQDGILVFSPLPGACISAKDAPRSEPTPKAKAQPAAAPPPPAAPVQKPHVGKTIGEWTAEQAAFKDEAKLPEGWLRIKSRSNGDVYFFNKKTQETTFDFPLPPGWTRELSKSTGKPYYFNAAKKQSSFEIPTA